MRKQQPPEEWARQHELFQAALDLPPDQRPAFLMAHCADAPHLQQRVEALLEAAAAAEPWIEQPAALIRSAAREAFRSAHDAAAAEQDAALAGRLIGPYRIVREVARGGMGTIYLAERADGQFEQTVALKLLRRGLDTDDIVDRFLSERQILATLAHPNIARLFDGGATEDGRPYLVLEYVDGERITDYCDARRLDVEQRLHLFTRVCEAVLHAHRNLVLHRDLKPSNILVTKDGTVKLLDFGIAKLLGEPAESPRTRTGLRLMTPEYASPEQLSGGAVTAATDVYQLGRLLHELLTGRLRDTDRAGLRRMLRGDLDAIVLKALRRDPAERYTSVTALMGDLERYRQGLPVHARRGTLGYRTRKLVRRNRGGLVAASGLLLGLLGMTSSLTYNGQPDAPSASSPAMQLVAVGEIQGYEAETAVWSGAMRDVLTTGLARIRELSVLSSTRMAELVEQARATGDGVATTSRAARLGGAGELIEGSLHRRPTGYQLDLRWIEIGSGRIRQTFTVEGRGINELAERATVSVAEAYGLLPPVESLASVTTTSSAGARLYEEGVRAYYAGDAVEARSFLRAAVAEDSTFPLASYYLGLATPEHAPRLEHLSRALRFAGRSSDRERLLIRALWARELWEPSLPELADSLTTRYPSEPDGHYLMGRARVMAGDFLGAIPHLERVVAMDSMGLHVDGARCRACDALTEIVTAYVYADSFAAAERVARRWVRLQPAAARSWHNLAWTLWRQDRFEEAIAARRTAASYRTGNAGDEVYPATAAIRAGDFAAADRLLRERIRHGPPQVRTTALFWLTLSLRHQGRLREALATAREYRETVADGVSDLSAGGQEAQVLFDMGRYSEAADLFDAISLQPWSDPANNLTPARDASRRLRGLTQVVAARAAEGNLSALEALADTMAVLGQQSGLGVYRLLHHYPRGLLLAAAGRNGEAAARLRRATFSRVASHPAPKLALARTLLHDGRPQEAVAVLQAALRGPNAGPGAYATRTEMHELLGDAWAAVARADSAAVHYRRVLAAWEHADPQLHPRRDAVRRRLSSLTGEI